MMGYLGGKLARANMRVETQPKWPEFDHTPVSFLKMVLTCEDIQALVLLHFLVWTVRGTCAGCH